MNISFYRHGHHELDSQHFRQLVSSDVKLPAIPKIELGAALAFGSHGLAGLFQRLRGRDAAVSDSARRIGAEIDAVAEAAAAAPTPDDVAATDRDSR